MWCSPEGRLSSPGCGWQKGEIQMQGPLEKKKKKSLAHYCSLTPFPTLEIVTHLVNTPLSLVNIGPGGCPPDPAGVCGNIDRVRRGLMLISGGWMRLGQWREHFSYSGRRFMQKAGAPGTTPSLQRERDEPHVRHTSPS